MRRLLDELQIVMDGKVVENMDGSKVMLGAAGGPREEPAKQLIPNAVVNLDSHVEHVSQTNYRRKILDGVDSIDNTSSSRARPSRRRAIAKAFLDEPEQRLCVPAEVMSAISTFTDIHRDAKIAKLSDVSCGIDYDSDYSTNVLSSTSDEETKRERLLQRHQLKCEIADLHLSVARSIEFTTTLLHRIRK